MKLLIFNRSFFNFSETFIYNQIKDLPPDIELALMGYKFINDDIFPLKAKRFTVTENKSFADRVLTGMMRRVAGWNNSVSFLNFIRIKKILRREKIDLIHAHFGYNALFIYPMAKALNIPLIVTFHGIDASPEFLNRKIYNDGIRKVLKYASRIIIVSPHMVDTLEASKWKEKIQLIHCGTNPALFSNDHKLSESNTSIRLLHSGRIVSKKGVPDLIRVCLSLSKKYPQLVVDIIGDGPELEESRKLAESAGATNIIFHGAKPFEGVKKMMSEADIFVLNSRVGDKGDMEGTPVSLLEAMSMEVAVVSTMHAGIPLAIDNGKNGFIVPERDNAALETAIEKLITDPGLRLRFGKAARQTVKEKFTIEEMNKEMLEVYRSAGLRRQH